MIKYGIKNPLRTRHNELRTENYANEKLKKVNESLEEVIKTL